MSGSDPFTLGFVAFPTKNTTLSTVLQRVVAQDRISLLCDSCMRFFAPSIVRESRIYSCTELSCSTCLILVDSSSKLAKVSPTLFPTKSLVTSMLDYHMVLVQIRSAAIRACAVLREIRSAPARRKYRKNLRRNTSSGRRKAIHLVFIKPREHGDCMFRNEWFMLKQVQLQALDLGNLACHLFCLGIMMSNKSTGSHRAPRL